MTSNSTIDSNETAQPEAKTVPERDLLAVKYGLQKQLDESQLAAKVQLDTALNQLAQAEAKVKTLEEKIALTTATETELTSVKAALEAASKRSAELETKALEYRRKVVSTTYGIPEDTIKDQNDEQLSMFEKALKVVQTAKGVGNYAIGGSGGTGAAPTDPMQRAHSLIAKAKTEWGKGTKE